MAKFDIAVLGGGPGGYVAAIRAAQLGKKIVIIDEGNLGGVCLNWGCIPTKALLKNAEVLHSVKNSKKFGITIPEYEVDFGKTVKRSRDVSQRLSKGIEFLMKKNKITHIIGQGRIKLANAIEVIHDKKEDNVEEQANSGDKKDDKKEDDPTLAAKEKRISQMKKMVLLKKMQAVRSGAGAEITASYEPEGEVIDETLTSLTPLLQSPPLL